METSSNVSAVEYGFKVRLENCSTIFTEVSSDLRFGLLRFPTNEYCFCTKVLNDETHFSSINLSDYLP